jgi:hypothetical protein
MPQIQVFAGQPIDPADERLASTVHHGSIALSEISETLRKIGLEYKTADYFTSRQVIIVIDPDPGQKVAPEVREKIREAATALEATGQL